MTWGDYVVGTAALVVGFGALIWGAVRLRAALLPHWSGAPARLAETIVAVGVAVGISEVLGILGALARGPVYASFVVFAVVVRLACRDPSRAPTPTTTAVSPLRRGEVAVATFGVVLVLGQWTTQLVDTLRRGMTHADTLWYHGPHSARFLQDGSITQLLGPRGAQETYYASNSELIHAIVMLPFHRDLLSPLVSLGWMCVALLSAWCIGRGHGVGATCTLGAAMVLSLPVLAGSQVGQGGNDLPAAALLLAAVALLLTDPASRVAVGLAAVAAGLAIATKPTVGVAVLVITIGVLIAAFQARRLAIGAIWVVGVAVAGSYWYVKNLVTVGNPLPGVEIGVFGFSLPLVTPKNNCCPVSYFVTDGPTWHNIFLPGLKQALSPAWPLVVGLALAGGVLTVTMGRNVLERVVGAAVVASALGYVFTPLTAAGLAGGLFPVNLRYLTPALLLGCMLLPRWRIVSEQGRWWLCSVLFLVALLFGYFARHYEHAPAWPVQYAVGVVFAIASGAAILVLVAPSRPSTARRRRRIQPALAVLALVAVIAVGWPVQRAYYHGRYRTVGIQQDPFSLAFNDLDHQRVALFGSAVQYALLGPDLTNVVRAVDAPNARTGRRPARPIESCRVWRNALRAGRFNYIILVTGTLLFTSNPEPWVSTDPASVVVDRGNHYRVIHVAGTLDPEDCDRAVRVFPKISLGRTR